MFGAHIPYFEKQLCDDCMCVHWVELTRHGKQICHGETYYPKDSPTHYARRSGRGIELVEKYNRTTAAIPLPPDWQMAESLADMREEVAQGW